MMRTSIKEETQRLRARVANPVTSSNFLCAFVHPPPRPHPQWPPRVLRGFWRRRRPGIPPVVPGQREEARCVARAMACMPSRLLCERIRTPRACPSRHVQNENRGTEGIELNFGAIPSVGATYSGTQVHIVVFRLSTIQEEPHSYLVVRLASSSASSSAMRFSCAAIALR